MATNQEQTMATFETALTQSALGKEVGYENQYNPDLLFPIARDMARKAWHQGGALPFTGMDVWTAYEISWLNSLGKPQMVVAEICVPADSTNLFESKSLKLYLNSFRSTRFESAEAIKTIIQTDLSKITAATVAVKFILPNEFPQQRLQELPGLCLDDLTITTNVYQIDSNLLSTENAVVNETVYSHLFASNCPVTGQPDWASVLIRYSGKQISHDGLLKYLISFRQHTGFHEACAEKIFVDLMQRCAPEKLTVYMRYTRRGGIDVNPFRSNFEKQPDLVRCFRQ